MKLVFPLRYTVPAVLFILGLILGIGTFFHEKELAMKHLEKVSRYHARNIGVAVASLAAPLLEKNEIELLKRQLTFMRADSLLTDALVCLPDGTIVATSSARSHSERISELDWAADLEGLKLTSKPVTATRREGSVTVGAFPLGGIGSESKGFVLLRYDLSYPREELLKGVLFRWAWITGSVIFICVLTWIFFHLVVSSRVGRLTSAISKLAQGDLTASARLKGSDELARLSQSFDQMAYRLFSHHEELKQANARMKQEITERQFIEEALRNSERRFRSIWENSLEAMRLTDSKGTILAVNPAFCRLVGLPPEELVEQPFSVSHDPEKSEESLIRYRERFATREVLPHQQKRVKLHNGTMVDLDATYSFIEMDRPLLLGIFRDVSDRVAAVEDLRAAKEFSENLIATANVMIVGVNRDHQITIFNETAEKISGYAKGEVEGKSWEHLVRGTQYRGGQTSSDTSNFAKTFEAPLSTKSGEERVISWQTNSIFENGEFKGTICFGIDTTDRKREEEQRLALERKLLDSQKLESLGVLAGGIAHDFNNLLTAILGNATLAARHLPEGSRVRTHLGNIEKTSLRAAELCKQMLAYSGKGRFSMQYVDLNEIVKETVELLEVSITKKASLRIELRPGIPGTNADPTQVRQILMNLVINASEAIGDKPGMIRIKTGIVDASRDYLATACVGVELQPGEYLYVEVSDTGCGMSPETMARIFDPFFTTKFTGRGLGMAAVLGIVRGHNGALKIDTQVGKGSTFRVLLPKTSQVPAASLTATTNGHPWKGEGTILVVDDDPTVRAVTSRMVEACGFQVLQAVDGRHAVEVFSEKRNQIKAVVLDLTMPNLDGQEAFREMRRLEPKVKVLLMSGFSEGFNPAQTLPGLGGFLQKPFRPEDLNSKLKSIISTN